jgi:hypothetical protein
MAPGAQHLKVSLKLDLAAPFDALAEEMAW